MGHFLLNPFIGSNRPLYEAIVAAGLATNLKLCLDAGDALSYSSGQKWLDRSGIGHDFFLGATGSATTDDPTFGTPSTPVAGGRSANEYFSFDGGDYFLYDTANEAWMETLHKVGAVFTIVGLVYLPTSGAGVFNHLFINCGNGGDSIGVFLGINGGNLTCFISRNTVSVAALNKISSSFIPAGWHMVAISLTESGGAGAGFLYRDGNFEPSGGVDTWNPAYSSPSTGSASVSPRIGSFAAVGSGFQGFNSSGTRIAGLALWQGTPALTKANLDSLWAIMRGRFSL